MLQRRSLFARTRAARDAFLPNVLLRTHDNARVRFYDDMVRGRVVTVNFMFTTCATFCPRATANLFKVQQHLGARLGTHVFMLSITVDPATDTADVLQRYAASYGVKPGWTFLTGASADIDRIRRRLGVLDDDPDRTQHTGILSYGNDATGSWSAMPVIAEAAVIARSLARLATPRT
jgi:protein SCO1/2